jgi:glycine cleavage system regulatory protein
MARLAGKFAGILRVSVPSVGVEALSTALQGLEAQGLRLLMEWSPSDEAAQNFRQLILDLIGNDRVGIIRDISQALARRGINIDELHTQYVSAPMTGEMLFKATAQLRVPSQVQLAELQEILERLAHDLVVDITLADVSAKEVE